MEALIVEFPAAVCHRGDSFMELNQRLFKYPHICCLFLRVLSEICEVSFTPASNLNEAEVFQTERSLIFFLNSN